IRALYVVTEIDEHFSDAAHAAATYADKMDAPDAAHLVVGGTAKLRRHDPRSATSRTARIRDSAACGMARVRARLAISRSCRRSAASWASSAATRVGSKCRSAISAAAPGSVRK